MSTCKDCIHNEMCFATHTEDSPTCCDFKDRSKFIELPFKLGEKVYTSVDGEVEEYRISEIRMNKNDFYTQLSVKCDKLFKTSAYDPDRRSKHIEFGVGNINKEVFLTKEKAEQALRKGV